SGVPNLGFLGLQNNNLTELDLSNNPGIGELFVNNNNLTSLDLSNQHSLSQMFAEYNNLTSLIFGSSNVYHIRAYGNQLDHLDVSMLPNVKHLRVSNNGLTSLNMRNGVTTVLIDLQATGNSLSCIETTDPDYFNDRLENGSGLYLDSGVAFDESCCAYAGYTEATCTAVTFQPQTKSELQTAVDMWVDDNATALATYGEINTWDVSVVTDMSGLFQDKTTFNDDIGDWDVSNVTDMNKMFYTSDHSGIFNQDISGWDVSSVTDMNTMFKNNHVFNQDISGWDVSSVTNMSDMFKYTENLETDLSNWDVSNVTHMGTMFFHAENIIFSEGFASWDVSNVTNFGYMFIETTFNMDISSWDVSSATNMSGMFLQTNISDENKCAIHTSFSSNGNWPYDWS
ncbi:uncharacterized protein METZ01_LOCUS291330, partial [marine metagenome]